MCTVLLFVDLGAALCALAMYQINAVGCNLVAWPFKIE